MTHDSSHILGKNIWKLKTKTGLNGKQNILSSFHLKVRHIMERTNKMSRADLSVNLSLFQTVPLIVREKSLRVFPKIKKCFIS